MRIIHTHFMITSSVNLMQYYTEAMSLDRYLCVKKLQVGQCATDSLRNSVAADVTLPGGWSAWDELHLADPAPNKLTRTWQDEKAEARGAGITGSSQADVFQETRKSTTEFTFAPSWRADCILCSSVMTQATRSGRKIGWGELFKEELSGVMRIR